MGETREIASLFFLRQIINMDKDKIKKEDLSKVEGNLEFIENEENTNASLSNLAEALGALLALGYSEKEAEMALSKIDKTESLENIIKNSLKALMG